MDIKYELPSILALGATGAAVGAVIPGLYGKKKNKRLRNMLLGGTILPAAYLGYATLRDAGINKVVSDRVQVLGEDGKPITGNARTKFNKFLLRSASDVIPNDSKYFYAKLLTKPDPFEQFNDFVWGNLTQTPQQPNEHKIDLDRVDEEYYKKRDRELEQWMAGNNQRDDAFDNWHKAWWERYNNPENEEAIAKETEARSLYSNAIGTEGLMYNATEQPSPMHQRTPFSPSQTLEDFRRSRGYDEQGKKLPNFVASPEVQSADTKSEEAAPTLSPPVYTPEPEPEPEPSQPDAMEQHLLSVIDMHDKAKSLSEKINQAKKEIPIKREEFYRKANEFDGVTIEPDQEALKNRNYEYLARQNPGFTIEQANLIKRMGLLPWYNRRLVLEENVDPDGYSTGPITAEYQKNHGKNNSKTTTNPLPVLPILKNSPATAATADTPSDEEKALAKRYKEHVSKVKALLATYDENKDALQLAEELIQADAEDSPFNREMYERRLGFTDEYENNVLAPRARFAKLSPEQQTKILELRNLLEEGTYFNNNFRNAGLLSRSFNELPLQDQNQLLFAKYLIDEAQEKERLSHNPYISGKDAHGFAYNFPDTETHISEDGFIEPQYFAAWLYNRNLAIARYEEQLAQLISAMNLGDDWLSKDPRKDLDLYRSSINKPSVEKPDISSTRPEESMLEKASTYNIFSKLPTRVVNNILNAVRYT